jgi:hypothetical protein
MPAGGSTSSTLIWTTVSIHGNTIYLYEQDWVHLLEHPEMAGQDRLIKETVERPTVVREGRFPDSCAFDRPWSTNPEGVRVFVRHERETFLSGGCSGYVTTAFPINTRAYATNRVGPIIATYPENEPDKE